MNSHVQKRFQPESIRAHLRQFARSLGLVWESGRGMALGSAVTLLIQGLLPLVTLYLMKLVVDAAAAGVSASDKSRAYRHVLVWVGMAALAALFTAGLDCLAGLLGEVQGLAVTDHMNEVIQAKANELDLAYYENAEYFNTLHRAQQEAPFRPARIVRNLVQIGQSGLSLLGVAALILSLNWAIGLLLFAAALPALLVRLKHANETHQLQQRITKAERRADYYHMVLTFRAFAKEVRLFHLAPTFREQFRQVRAELRRQKIALAMVRSFGDLWTQAVAIVPVFGAYSFVAYETTRGVVSLGSLVMYFAAFQRGQSFLRSCLQAFGGLYEDSVFLTSLYKLLDIQPQVRQPLDPQPYPAWADAEIVFDEVSFRYPNSDRLALDGVSLRIRPGEVVALVGENGSGKTTLVKLLCRLYDATEGRITIGGSDIRELDLIALRRQITAIFQDFIPYEMTARENIRIGNLDVSPDDPRITEAARLAGAHDLVLGLKNGYDTPLGKWLEDGEELSMGEWQRIALARAFLRDSEVMILDEPNSALDARAEYLLFENFRRLVGGRTAILISHRLSSVRMVDRIYVLAEGRIVESGTHDELISRQGRYADLFDLQARSYK